MLYPRPLSPHLQIYKPQLTSILSISHRMAGVVLTIGIMLIAYWLNAASSGAESYDLAREFLSQWYSQVALGGWTFCFFYHLCNGVRHLFWDAGYGFELSTVYKSGWMVVGVSAFLTIVALMAAYF